MAPSFTDQSRMSPSQPLRSLPLHSNFMSAGSGGAVGLSSWANVVNAMKRTANADAKIIFMERTLPAIGCRVKWNPGAGILECGGRAPVLRSGTAEGGQRRHRFWNANHVQSG